MVELHVHVGDTFCVWINCGGPIGVALKSLARVHPLMQQLTSRLVADAGVDPMAPGVFSSCGSSKPSERGSKRTRDHTEIGIRGEIGDARVRGCPAAISQYERLAGRAELTALGTLEENS